MWIIWFNHHSNPARSFCYYSHFADENAEAQRNEVICPKSHSYLSGRARFWTSLVLKYILKLHPFLWYNPFLKPNSYVADYDIIGFGSDSIRFHPVLGFFCLVHSWSLLQGLVQMSALEGSLSLPGRADSQSPLAPWSEQGYTIVLLDDS